MKLSQEAIRQIEGIIGFEVRQQDLAKELGRAMLNKWREQPIAPKTPTTMPGVYVGDLQANAQQQEQALEPQQPEPDKSEKRLSIKVEIPDEDKDKWLELLKEDRRITKEKFDNFWGNSLSDYSDTSGLAGADMLKPASQEQAPARIIGFDANIADKYKDFYKGLYEYYKMITTESPGFNCLHDEEQALRDKIWGQLESIVDECMKEANLELRETVIEYLKS